MRPPCLTKACLCFASCNSKSKNTMMTVSEDKRHNDFLVQDERHNAFLV